MYRLPWLPSPPTLWHTSTTQSSSWQLTKPLWLSPSSTCSSFPWPCSHSSSPAQCRPASLSSASANSWRTKNWIQILWNGILNHLQVHKVQRFTLHIAYLCQPCIFRCLIFMSWGQGVIGYVWQTTPLQCAVQASITFLIQRVRQLLQWRIAHSHGMQKIQREPHWKS